MDSPQETFASPLAGSSMKFVFVDRAGKLDGAVGTTNFLPNVTVRKLFRCDTFGRLDSRYDSAMMIATEVLK